MISFDELGDLISHKHWVHSTQSVGDVFQIFAAHEFDYMAVLEGEKVLGLCSKRDVGMLLGSKYGFGLFAAKPIGDHLTTQPVCIRWGTPIEQVFRAVFSRGEETFFDDVVLIGSRGEFLGLIFTLTLVKLQNQFHLENIGLLEKQGREIRLKNEQMEKDLLLSRELQRGMLPISYPRFPPRPASEMEALRFHHHYQPVGLVGGDFFLVKKITDASAGVFISDVMGHGVRAAIITAMLRVILESFDCVEFLDPARLLGHVNLELGKVLDLGNGGLFATGLYLFLDAENRIVRYSTAGHCLPLHVSPEFLKAESLQHPEPGTVLGVFREAGFSNNETGYRSGDSLILYTDGITEVENPQGCEFGLDRVRETVLDAIGRPTPEVFEKLVGRAEEFAANGEFTDDICLVGIDLA